MPISSTTNRVVSTGNGVTTVFPFPYYFLADSDLVVLKTEIASGAETTLTLNTDYTVTGAGDESGGNVILTTAPTSAYKLTRYRDPALTQEVDFQNNGPLPATSLERPVDKLTMIVQRLAERLGRALRLSDGDVSGADTTLPPPEAGKYLRWNTDGDGIENTTLVVPDGTVATATTTAEGIVELATQAEVDAGTDAQRAVTSETLAGSALAGRVTAAETDIDSLQAFNVSDNLLINGGFAINQRAVTTGAADDTYCLDRWNLLTQTSTITVAQQSLQEDGTVYNIRLTQAQASAQRIGLEQISRAADCIFMRGRSIVLGARVRSSTSQTIRYAILEWTGTANSVTSDVVNDWTSSSYTTGNFFLASNLVVAAVGSKAVTANTWTDLTALTATISSAMNNLIAVFWTESTMAQNETLDIARAQLVAGTTLPEFKNEDFAITQMRCSKYYYKTFNVADKPAQNIGYAAAAMAMPQVVGASTAQPCAMRLIYPYSGLKSIPTVTLFNPFAANAEARNTTRATSCSATTVVTNGSNAIEVTFTTPAGSSIGDVISVHFTADAEL